MRHRRTERGFAIYGAFKDSYGNEVRVQESSNAGGACCWIFCHRVSVASLPVTDTAPHLSRKDVRLLIRYLERFMDDTAPAPRAAPSGTGGTP